MNKKILVMGICALMLLVIFCSGCIFDEEVDKEGKSNEKNEKDSDGDGILDNADAYPNDPHNGLDSDGDGVCDYEDVYPNDPLRTENLLGWWSLGFVDGIGNVSATEELFGIKNSDLNILNLSLYAVQFVRLISEEMDEETHETTIVTTENWVDVEYVSGCTEYPLLKQGETAQFKMKPGQIWDNVIKDETTIYIRILYADNKESEALEAAIVVHDNTAL